MELVIAEKPDAARAIAKMLGGGEEKFGSIKVRDDLVVTWLYGHLFELQDAFEYDEKYKSWRADELPIFPEKLILREAKDDYKVRQIKNVSQLVRRASLIVNAGDNDREGHLLVMELIEFFNFRGPIKRMHFTALSKDTLKKAWGSLLDNNQFHGLLESGKARSEADWLVGINLTRAFTCGFKRCGSDRKVTVGRVQSPILAMIVERDLLIENFKSVEYFLPKAIVEKDGKQFVMSWRAEHDAGRDSEGRLISLDIAKNAVIPASVKTIEVEFVETNAKSEGPPLPFRLTTLQSTCQSKFGFDADRTLEIAQSLYEKHKVLTYPRTKSSYLPESMHPDCSKVISSLNSVLEGHLKTACERATPSIKSAAFNDKKVDPAHHGIIPEPSPENFSLASLSEDELKVYELVVSRFLCQFFPDHLYDSTHVIAKDPYGRKYEARGRVSTDMGWRFVLASDDDGDDDNENDTDDEEEGLPKLVVGDAINVIKSGIEKKQTRPPQRYTSGSLMLDLENVHRVVERRAKYNGQASIEKLRPIIAKLKEVAGIGTEATRATMVKNMIKNEYVSKTKGKLISTPLGREIIGNIPEQIASPVMTALFEQALDQIVEGKLSRKDFIDKQKQWIVAACRYAAEKELKVTPFVKEGFSKGQKKPSRVKTDIKCGKCTDGYMMVKKSANGEFYGCSTYPACKNTMKIDEKQKAS